MVTWTSSSFKVHLTALVLSVLCYCFAYEKQNVDAYVALWKYKMFSCKLFKSGLKLVYFMKIFICEWVLVPKCELIVTWFITSACGL